MVDAESFERYRKALMAITGLTEDAVKNMLSGIVDMPPEEQARAMLESYPKILKQYGKVAADVARQFYQEQRDSHFEDDDEADDYTAQAAQEIPTEWAEEDLLEAAKRSHGTVAMLPAKASKRVIERADQTLIQNSERDPAHPKWAVVPHMGACAWCIMVGSRGFVYKSALTSDAQRHLNCKCSIVVDFDTKDPSLEGYDVAALYKQYEHDLENGIVTIHGSSIGSIGLKSGGHGEVVGKRGRRIGVRRRSQADMLRWANETIVMFDKAQDVGQFDALVKSVNDVFAKSGNALTDRQVTGVKNAFRRAAIRLGVKK